MSDPRLRLNDPSAVVSFDTPRAPLGRYLVDAGLISPAALLRALDLQKRIDAPLGEILIAEGLVDSDEVLEALSKQHGLYRADLVAEPPRPDLSQLLPAQFWLEHRVAPWMRLGPGLVLATSRPDQFDTVRQALPDGFGMVLPVVAPEEQILQTIAQAHGRLLAHGAERRVDVSFSCRSWEGTAPTRFAAISLVVFILLAILIVAPVTSFAVISCAAVCTLFLITGLKLAGFGAQIVASLPVTNPAPTGLPDRLPRVSVLVPLFHETEIAGALIKRLSRLTYPKALLDVVLVLEEKDKLTPRTLARTALPDWMRVVTVPDTGSVTTKPRALNYALDFCRGSIIGIWDAEDAPAPDQIERVVTRFAQAADDVVCLQGILDYYNPRTNWLARCFTIEYASWFRVVLPGLARLGMVIPLGGTTLFMKRWALEKMGGWDAHNVTEDADLGVRITRFGYRTELLPTVTHEEANCRLWPWIKQRSRWLKGFMVTYLVHMRQPVALLRDLGIKRFIGVQAFFVGTLAQFLLAPVLWTFWAIPFGLDHPVRMLVSDTALTVIATLFLVTEVTNICVGAFAVSGRDHRFLIPWAATLTFYFPLGAAASYKALYELICKPFYWDKTQHGHAKSERRAMS
ncbi:glycosyltransferase [Thalassococcus sp. S3]|uniref:glycosyltransferase n=1 Tax=Thalassococcus sp. S3 TaxID=2017482 RepID=UPI0010248E52|nr:glycosyltransferase [Thalassococcus sp. S3]QBF32360.1 glycosyl transferase [Thalassococcus sp. S3]